MTSSDGRSTRWDEHRLSRRRELVDATLRAVREHGASVGMDGIAAAAGTSKTVFYRHFQDKQGLYAAVSARVDALILRDVMAAVGSPGSDLVEATGSPRDLIAAAIDSYLRLVERDPEVYRFVVGAPLLDHGPVADPASGVTHHVADQLGSVIAQALEGSPQGAGAAGVWAHGLVGMVRAAADQWLRHPGEMSREELGEHLAALAWSGLGSAWQRPTTRRKDHR